MPTSSRGLFRRPPQPQQRGGTRAKWFQPPDPVLQCLLDEMLADSPSMLLQMDEPSGNPQDSSAGGANDGTIVGGVTMGSTALVSTDTSADFNGTTGYVTVADGAWIDRGDAAFTIAVVIKQDTVGFWHIPFTKGLSAPALTINPSSIVRLQTGDGGTNTVAATNALTDTTSRHMIVATYDGTNGSIFVDGVDDTNVGSRLATTFVDNNQLVTIGADDGGSANFVDGRMAYVAYFPSAISASRIATWWTSIDVACSVGGSTVNVTAADSIATTDAVVRVGTFLRTMADSLALANTVARVATLLRTATDAFATSEAVVGVRSLVRTAADSIAIGDTVARILTLARTAADSVSVGNTVARVGTFLRTTADSVSVAESVAASKVILRTLADSLAIADAVTRTGTFLRTAADTLTVGNTVARVVTLARSASDAIGLSDSVTRIGTFLRTAADSVSIAEAVTQLKVILRTVADSVGISEAATRTVTLARTLSDSATIGNAVVRVTTAARTASDAIAVSEAVAQLKVILRTLSDSLSIGNTVSRVATLARTASDGVTVGNTVARVLTAVRTLADSVTASESVVRVLTAARSAADSINVAAAVVGQVFSGGVGTVGGFPPIAAAASFISRAIGRHDKPSASASNPVPGAEADSPKPKGS